jgi:acetoacetate decarboxylase
MATVRYGARREELQPAEAGSTAAWGLGLHATYETDPGLVEQVLPRPLEPTGDPLVHVSIGMVEMAGGARFGTSRVAVPARHGDVVGAYPLVLPMSAEMVVIGGRETFGEPKKLADIELTRKGDDLHGTVTRKGVTCLEMRGRAIENLPTPPPQETLDFYFKFMISPDGKGFDVDPALVYCRRENAIRGYERVEGEIVLRDSSFDPVADFPVRRIVSFHLLDAQMRYQRAEIVDRVPGEWIAPFAHQRYDGFSWKR